MTTTDFDMFINVATPRHASSTYPEPQSALMKVLIFLCFINVLFVSHVQLSSLVLVWPGGRRSPGSSLFRPFINRLCAPEYIDDTRSQPPNRPATLMVADSSLQIGLRHWWMGLENQKCIDEWVLKTKSASMNGSWKPKVHRWTGLGNQKCIDEWVLETKSASMNGSWKPKVHRWMGLGNQKCIDEWVLKTKSASMNGSWKPKVHRWMGLENQKCIDEWVLETKSASMNGFWSSLLPWTCQACSTRRRDLSQQSHALSGWLPWLLLTMIWFDKPKAFEQKMGDRVRVRVFWYVILPQRSHSSCLNGRFIILLIRQKLAKHTQRLSYNYLTIHIWSDACTKKA